MTLLSPVFSSLVLPKKDTTTTWSVVLAPQVSNVKNDELLTHFLRSGVMTDNREVTSSGTMKAWLLLCKGRNCFAPGLPWRMNQLVRKQQSSACVLTIRSDPNAKDRRRFCPFWRASCIFSKSHTAFAASRRSLSGYKPRAVGNNYADATGTGLSRPWRPPSLTALSKAQGTHDASEEYVVVVDGTEKHLSGTLQNVRLATAANLLGNGGDLRVVLEQA